MLLKILSDLSGTIKKFAKTTLLRKILCLQSMGRICGGFENASGKQTRIRCLSSGYFEFYAKWLFVQSSPPVKIWTVSRRKRKITKALGQTKKVRLQIPVVILQGN